MSSKPHGWTGLSGEWVSEGCYYCRRRIICWLYLYQGFFFIGTLYWVFLQSLFPVLFGWLCCFFTVKPIVGVNDRRGKNPFQSSSPPLMRKYRQVQTQFPFSIYRAAYSAVSPFFKCNYPFLNAAGRICPRCSRTGGRIGRGERPSSCCPPDLLRE